ncbi:nuclear pore complex protein NUP1-like [Ananas comosus]|uniref:Nuclear pore complex protein NUP1-like n=1 Tax=Ananas comosus TaxID=4615 RepID=A0A6P5FJ50_ANACO|nr:nuclear pore complex protein NUP1-like [Ananas comosus]
MATGSYEGGGIGGKIRRRPLRAAAAATPYDRPSAAAAAARGVKGASEAGRTSGWLSKLVDPASRLIAGSASKLFSSVFRKQFPALPPFGLVAVNYIQFVDQQDVQMYDLYLHSNCGNVQSREEVPEVTSVNPSLQTLDNQIGEGNNLTNNSGDKSLSELEKLLKQKTFTRAEFDHLTELLRSRTIEPDASKLAVNNDKKEELNVSKIELGLGSFRSHGVALNPAAGGTIPKEESASPAELAKAYMVSRSSKGSPSNFSMRSHVLLEDKATSSNAVYGTKTPLASVAPRSTLRAPALPGLNENGYITPRLHRRSAIYRMSRSPYFKGASSSNDVYALPSSSHQTPTKSMYSAGTQVLKRRSSVLDDEIGSVGPIRRIRQKSNMMSPSKDSRTIHHGNLLPSSSGTLENEVINGSGTIEKPSGVSKLDYTTDFENKEDKDNRILDDGIPPIPPQSATMAMKILKELDKLAPSPKEKSSEIKVAKVESTSKLNLRSSWDMDATGGSPLSGKQERLKEDDLLNGPLLGIKSTSQVGSAPAFTFVRNATSNVGEISHSAAVSTRGKPGFQMVISEDSSEIDDDSGNAVEAPVNNVVDKTESKTLEQKVESKTSDQKFLNFEAAGTERPLISAAKSTLSSDFVSSSEAEKKAPAGRGIVNNSTSFTFSVLPAPTNHLEQPPTPTMAAPSPEISAREKEQKAAPIFSFGLKKSPTPALPSTSTSAGVEVGTSSVTETSIFDNLKTEKGDVKRKASESLNVPETAASSAAPSPFSSPSLSNGLLHSSAPKFLFPAAPAAAPSEGPVASVFSTSSATSSNLFSSSAAPVFPTAPSFGFGSAISIGSQISAQPSEKFSDTANVTTVGATPVVSNSSLPEPVTSSALSSSSISSSPLATTSAFSSTGSLSDSKPSNLFSSSSVAQSSSAPSLPFTATGNSIVGFSTSAQSAGLSSSVATSSSQTGFTFGSIAGAAFGTQSTQTGSSTQQLSQSAPSQSSSQAGLNFGNKAGADLGTQPAQSGSITQQPSQSSSSHFSSFTSSAPTFTFGSSQTSLGDSQFGSTATASKPSSASSGFSFSATTAAPSGSSFMVSKPFSSGPGFCFASSSSPSSSSSTSSSIPVSSTLFSSSSTPSTPSTFNTTFGSTSSASTGFTFGQPASSSSTSSFPFGLPASSSSTSPFVFGQPSSSPSTSPFAFNTQTGPAFSFTSASATANSSPARPLFGTPSPVTGFFSGSPGNNDQMNVEDSMTDDTTAPSAAVSMVPTFGQPTGAPAAPVFSASPIPSGGAPIFQFGGNQQNSLPQNPSPFQPGGNLEFQGGSSFSLGSGGGDKSGRRIVKINRNKLRKK